MQPPQPPFTPPTALPGPSAASRVGGPAIGLMVTGGLGILMAIFNIFARGALLAFLASQQEFRHTPMPMASGGFGTIGGLIGLATSAFVIFSAIQMRQLRNYGLVIAGAILAMVPCFSPCCCVGLPIGIWALVVLFDAPVKASFKS